MAKFQASPTTFAISAVSSRNGTALEPGRYAFSVDVDANFLQGGSGVEALTTSWPIFAGQTIIVDVSDSSEAYIAAITAEQSGVATIGLMV